MKKCQNCGNDNQDDAVFCESCGEKLIVNIESEEINVTPIETCKQCGANRVENALFCEECGTGFEEKHNVEKKHIEESLTNQVSTSTDTQTTKSITQEVSRNKTSKKSKFLLVLLLILCLAVGGAYVFFKDKYSREKQIAAIITAINKKDDSYLSRRMNSDDPSLKISKETIAPMLTYFEENKDEINQLKDSFEKNKEYQGFSINEDGKELFLFPKYNIKITPVYSTVESNVNNSTIEMNGQKLITTTKDQTEHKIGPLVPGKYSFKATVKDKKDIKESSYNLVSKADEENIDTIDMNFVMVTIPVAGNVKEASVFVNDKEVGQLVDSETKVGPILWNNDLKIQLVKKTDSGELKSNVKELQKSDIDEYDSTVSTVYLDFKTADTYDIKSGLQLFYDDFESLVDSSSDYSATEFANKFFENGTKNSSFTGIDEYITWCRERSAKDEYAGVSFYLDVKNVEPISDNKYKIKYNVEYSTSYPYETNKDMRIEGFDYSNVNVLFELDEDSYDVKTFKFIDMGDGGKKVKDNRANE